MKKLLSVLIILISSWAEAEPVEQFIPMQTFGASTYYINTEIPGAGQQPMLVDTGSAYSVINEETLAYLSSNGLAQFIKQLRGRMADGSERIVPLYRIASMNLGGNCLIKDVDVAIINGNSRQIIGISTLMRAAPFGMSFDPPILSLNQCVMTEQQASIDEVKKLVTIQ
jgi:predicted aspartyl protease